MAKIDKNLFSKGLLLCAIFIHFPLVCLAKGQGMVDDSATSDMTTATIKMFGSLLLVIGVILCVFYILKRLKLKGIVGSKNNYLQVIASISLAPKRAITLVEVCGEWLVLGVGSENISLLEKVDREVTDAYKKLSDQEDKSSFHSILKKHVPSGNNLTKEE